MSEQNIDYRRLILEFIASLTLADHLGDVSDDMRYVLKKAGIKIDWDTAGELGTKLKQMGIKTLYGTEPATDDEEGDDEDR